MLMRCDEHLQLRTSWYRYHGTDTVYRYNKEYDKFYFIHESKRGRKRVR